ncbi:MAG TPA: ATP-dependent DNA helicase [Gammaproteobacteria bacterium]|nr:ATP-dependent DNA helicase [Gammaproteobacteria bacterium]
MPTAAEVLAADGPLARTVQRFQARSAQIEMATLIEATIAARGTLVCEAGTGTGKTFAYLVPVLLSGARSLVSTATRTLQDQLFHVDLPRIRRALGLKTKLALLKGRANYLCLHRLAQAAGDPLLGPREQRQLRAIGDWARATGDGDVSALAEVPEDSPIWPFVTSTVDNCLGSRCPRFEDCFVKEARRRAAAADLVVVNHYLLFADMALRGEGFGEILPTAQCVVIDEAHQLPELAALAFGQALSARQLRELARDASKAALAEAADMPDLREAARELEDAVTRAVAALSSVPGRQPGRVLAREPQLGDALSGARRALGALGERLQAAAERGEELEACARRAADFGIRFADCLEAGDEDWVSWFESSGRGFVLHATPLSVAERYQAQIAQYPAAWIYCSGTLAIDGQLTHFRRELGIEEASEAVWASPFDYARQSLLYLPKLDCDPGDPRYLPAFVEEAAALVAASRGRAFLLFTSYRALEYCADALRERLPYPILVQGEAPRARLLEDFKRLGNAVLFGTSTFWEGVDVRGEALSLVVIDKLPFAPPDDPIAKARAERLAAEGRSAFQELQLPAAVIALKQGAGRLIRDPADRGVLVLCDPRLRTRSYGRVFLRSLPPMRQTSARADVQAFFDTLAPA